MRNIFDQYEQPENRLTHALATVLDQERKLLVPFLRWLGIKDVPKSTELTITEQQVPGLLQEDADELIKKGLPDIAVFDNDSWVVLFESKVQAQVSLGQVERHRNTVRRHGYDSPWLVIISVEELRCELPARTIAITWRKIYAWMNGHSTFWPQQLVRYMQVFEQKMLQQQYDIRGTITVFDGLRFDKENPYTYHEGKRLIRLLGDLLQQNKDLVAIGVDPKGARRSAITGTGQDGVWDFLPLKVSRNAKQFTAYPHLTMGINRSRTTAAVTVPNGVKGGFRSKLSEMGLEGFLELVADLEKRLRPVTKQSVGSKPMMYVTQRHFRSQRSAGETDARLDADLRTSFAGKQQGIRYQPQWIEAIYQVLIKKRSNIQFGVDVQFRYTCPVIRSPEATELFVETWKALSPLVGFVLHD